METYTECTGTRNGPRVVPTNAKQTTEPAERTLSDLDYFKDRTGRGWMSITLDRNFNLKLPCEEMISIAWYDQLDEFHKEDARKVHSIEFRDDKGLQQIIAKDDVFGFLDAVGAGKKQLTICMDNGFTRKGAFTYDANRFAVNKLRAFIWAISPALGLTIKEVVDGTTFRKVIVDEDGLEMSPGAIVERYRALCVQPKLVCSLTVDERGIHSIQGIKRA